MKIFLKAKHWQLFLAIWGIPFISHFIYIQFYLFDHNAPFALFNLLISNYFNGMILFLWLWSVGQELHRHLPDAVKINLRVFHIAMAGAILYILFALISLALTFLGWLDLKGSPSDILFQIHMRVFPLGLIMLFSAFYAFWLNAKMLKSIELGRAATMDDFGQEFSLFFISIWGVWVIQPQINELAEEG